MNRLIDAIVNSKKIALFTHVEPDADALCSCFALKNLIKNNYDVKYIDVFIEGPVRELYNHIIRDEVVNPKPLSSYDMAVVLDCPSTSRLGGYESYLKNIPIIATIDHHATNEKFGTLNYVLPKASSTCEIVFLIAKANQLTFTNSIARNIFQGIITDTNCFTSLSLTNRTHKVVSELMTYKFDYDKIKEYYFKTNSIAKTKLLSKALQSLKFYKGDKITTMKIPNAVFTKIGAGFEDTLGIVDNGINIDKTEVSAILIEKEPQNVYVSLRSKGNVDVGQIAKAFNGGGSPTVAAFQTTGDIKTIEQSLLNEIFPLVPDNGGNDDILI